MKIEEVEPEETETIGGYRFIVLYHCGYWQLGFKAHISVEEAREDAKAYSWADRIKIVKVKV